MSESTNPDSTEPRFTMRMADCLISIEPRYAGIRRLCTDYLVSSDEDYGMDVADPAPAPRGDDALTRTNAPVSPGAQDEGSVLKAPDSRGASETGASSGTPIAHDVTHAASPLGSSSAPTPPQLTVVVSREDIEAECTEGSWSDAYLETLAVYRAIAEWLPGQDRMLVHGAAIELDGRAFLFCAPSGAGKSTHVALWRRRFGNRARILNGDKPIVAREGDRFRVYGTPWAGKEGWQENASAPLCGICLLERGEHDRAWAITAADALDDMMRQVYLPRDPTAALLTLGLVDTLLARVPLVRLACTPTERSVVCSHRALTQAADEMEGRCS